MTEIMSTTSRSRRWMRGLWALAFTLGACTVVTEEEEAGDSRSSSDAAAHGTAPDGGRGAAPSAADGGTAVDAGSIVVDGGATSLLDGGAAMAGDAGSPADGGGGGDAGGFAEPGLSTWDFAATEGSVHVIELDTNDALDPAFEGFAIEADCGAGFTDTGLIVTPTQPAVAFFEPAPPAPAEPNWDHELELASERKSNIIDAYAELLSEFDPEFALETCLELPDCADSLNELDAEWEQADTDARAALQALETRPVLAEPLPLEPGCQFAGTALKLDPPNPPGRVGADRVVARGYDDWTRPVEAPEDPCFGKTPIECYRDLIEQYKKRACDEIDAQGNPNPNPLPERHGEPCVSICLAIKANWADFPEPLCDRLGAGGITSRISEGGAIEGQPGTRSRVRFDWKGFLTTPWSYLMFKHELDHVVYFGRTANDVGALHEEKTAKQAEVTRLLDEARAAGRETPPDMQRALELARQSDVLRAEVILLCDARDKALLEDILRRETRAFEPEVLNAAEWVQGSPIAGRPDEGPRTRVVIKMTVAEYIRELQYFLDRYPGVVVDDAVAELACASIQRVRDHAQMTVLEDGKSIWECIGAVTDQVEENFDAVEGRLGCE